jgi:hypothetical protein
VSAFALDMAVPVLIGVGWLAGLVAVYYIVKSRGRTAAPAIMPD